MPSVVFDHFKLYISVYGHLLGKRVVPFDPDLLLPYTWHFEH